MRPDDFETVRSALGVAAEAGDLSCATEALDRIQAELQRLRDVAVDDMADSAIEREEFREVGE